MKKIELDPIKLEYSREFGVPYEDVTDYQRAIQKIRRQARVYGMSEAQIRRIIKGE